MLTPVTGMSITPSSDLSGAGLAGGFEPPVTGFTGDFGGVPKEQTFLSRDYLDRVFSGWDA